MRKWVATAVLIAVTTLITLFGYIVSTEIAFVNRPRPLPRELEAIVASDLIGGVDCNNRTSVAQSDREGRRSSVSCSERTQEHRLRLFELAQQVRAANASEAAVITANHGLLPIWIQTLGASFTLLAAVAAAVYARQAAQEARRSADLARDGQIAEYRPWLTIKLEPLSGRQPEPEKIGISNIFCQVQIENLGRGAATKVHCSTSTYNIHDTTSITPYEVDREIAGGSLILPGQHIIENRFANNIQDAWTTAAVIVTVQYINPTTNLYHHTRFPFWIRGYANRDERGNPLPIFDRFPIGEEIS